MYTFLTNFKLSFHRIIQSKLVFKTEFTVFCHSKVVPSVFFRKKNRFFDAFYEFLKINNILGLKLESYRGNENFYLTGFLNDEKKLGSFLVRILPFIISLIIYLNYLVIDFGYI